MAVVYKENQKGDTPVDPVSLTEQEHIDSCDINKMLRRAAQGYQIRGGSVGPWQDGLIDDTTMDGLSFRIKKAELEAELTKSAKENELTEEEAKYVPQHIQKKFGIKIKKKTPAPKNDELNDEKEGDQKPNSPNPDQKPNSPNPDQKPKPDPS